MEDRKLYHLVNGEFVLNGMPSVRIPTYEEVNGHLEILRNVGFFDDHSVAEPVCFAGLSNGKRNTEKQASVYDAMLAEIYADRNAEKSRVRNRRSERRNHMAENWEAEKDRRKDIHLDWVERDSRRKFGHGKTHYWDSNAERKIRYAESVARADWELEQDSIVEDKYYAELEAEYAEWERRYRHEKYMRKLNDWLKYA